MKDKRKPQSSRPRNFSVDRVDKNGTRAPGKPSPQAIAPADSDHAPPVESDKDHAVTTIYPDRIDMRLHEIERAFYDPRADALASIALDESVSAETEIRLLREAEAIYQSARTYAPRPNGGVNIRAAAIDALRRIGGAR